MKLLLIKVLVVLKGRRKEEEETTTTTRKTRSLTRADQKLLRDEEQKVKVKEGAKANSSALKTSSGFAGKKVGKRSLDLVLVDLKKAKAGPEESEEVFASEKDAEEEVVEIENDSFEEVGNTSFNAGNSEELIQNLTNQLSTQEDKYVEMKAENLSKDQTIRKLSQNLSKLDEKFGSFKSDRADLVKYMQLNVDLIKKLEVMSEAVKARDAEIEALKNVKKPKTENVTHRQDIENMRTVMAKQSRALINLEVKMKETKSNEETFQKEKAKLLLKIANLEEELKNHDTLKVENDALRNTIDEKTIECEDLERASEEEKKMVEALKGQLDSFQSSQSLVFSKIESMQTEQISGQNLITKLRNDKKILSQKVVQLKSALEKTEENIVKKENDGKENENIVVDLKDSIKHKDSVIEQLELENNKLFRQNVENLKAEKEKSAELESKLRKLEEEKLGEITLEENVKSEKYRIPKLKRESALEAKEDPKSRKESPRREGRGYSNK